MLDVYKRQDIYVSLQYGVNVPAVSIEIQKAVKAAVYDICLLYTSSIRTVDHHGRFQSTTDKSQTLLYVSGVYVSFLLFEVIFYLILKHRRNKQVLEQVL